MVRLMVRLTAALLLAAASFAPTAIAQMPMAGTGAAPKTGAAWATENDAAMARMDKAMSDMPRPADEDHAFVEGMIPHHQGAVDMARVELAHGRDQRLRQLARAIIVAQDRELATMRAWLRAHGGAS